jgi:hypothetical protein
LLYGAVRHADLAGMSLIIVSAYDGCAALTKKFYTIAVAACRPNIERAPAIAPQGPNRDSGPWALTMLTVLTLFSVFVFKYYNRHASSKAEWQFCAV